MRRTILEHARKDTGTKWSPRRIVTGIGSIALVTGVATAAVAIIVAGLPQSGTTPPAANTPTRSATASPTPTPTRGATPTPEPPPTPTSSPSSIAEPAATPTCLQIVDPAVVDTMTSSGLEADHLWPDQTEFYGTQHQRFAEFGGVSCRWGKPQSDNVRIYSYTPVTPQQSALLESELTMAGYTSEPRDRGTVYIAPEVPGTFFLFTGDEVFETHGVESFDDLIPYRQ
jgi:hypothetical protein